MTYPEVIAYLYKQLPMFSRVGVSAFKKDLSNIRALCKALGNPQEKFKSIHVGGTNGKGSVAHTLAAVFQTAGYKTGLHTSPHLMDFRERIRINGKETSETFVVNFVEKHFSLIKDIQPSFFEISVAMAFQWFAKNEVDIAIVEVGLGGRLDSTNILQPILSVITNISLEHTQLLGDTKTLIAGEKAGIIKKDTPVVIGETNEETQPVFLKKADEMKVDIYFADQIYTAQQIDTGFRGQEIKISFPEKKEMKLMLDLGGGYQLQNIQTAFGAIDVLKKQGWQLYDHQIKKALKQVKKKTGLRGRWDILEEKPLVIADTSHNKAGLASVLEQIKSLSFQKLHILLGFVSDKNVEEILPLFPKKAIYYFSEANNPRSLSASKLKNMAFVLGLQGDSYPSVDKALTVARETMQVGDMLLITGSTFIVAEALY